MPIARLLFTIVVLLMLCATAGCATTPEARWYQERQALTAANNVYLANVPQMSDEQIARYGQLLQTARADLNQAKAKLPGGGPDFDTELDLVEAILKQLAATPDTTPATQHSPEQPSHESH